MLLSDCLTIYQHTAADLSPKTVQRMSYEVHRWVKVMGRDDVRRITLTSFHHFRNACLQSGLASRSIESNISTVRLLLTTAVESGDLQAVPPPGRRLRKPRPTPEPLSPEQVGQLYCAARVARWPDRHGDPVRWWRAFLALSYWTGLRLADACWRLAWRHVDEQARVLSIEAGKTGHLHRIPLPDPLLAILRRVRSRTLVLDAPHSMRNFYQNLRVITDAANIGRAVTTKSLRQTAVSQWSRVHRDAGRIIHGCGLGDVRDHYVQPLDILQEAAPRMPWPFPECPDERQLQLF